MPKKITECLELAMEKFDKIYHSKTPLPGISTGFMELDQIIGGLQPNNLITIAGRPSMGKSILAMNMAVNVAIRNDLPVLIFSMETSADDFARRILASLCRIDYYRLTHGKLEDEDWPRISSVVTLLTEKKIFIDASSGLTPEIIYEKVTKLTSEHGELGLIIVDYIQLMNVESGNLYPRYNQISEITRFLKSLSKSLNVCIIAMSQLNRDCDNRVDKRPIFGDLLDSSSIENDSDIIIFMYRDEVYYENKSNLGTAEIIVAKNRQGPIGKVRLNFLSQYQCFENYSYV